MSMLNQIALWIGYACMVAGGVAIVGLCAALAMDYGWTVIKRVHDFQILRKAVRMYEWHKAGGDLEPWKVKR